MTDIHKLWEFIKDSPSVTPTQKWIPISEKLPNKNGTYLVTIENYIGRHIEVLDYANDLYNIDGFDFHDKKGVAGWYVFDGEWGCFIDVDNVVAWMPLPKPYTESEE